MVNNKLKTYLLSIITSVVFYISCSQEEFAAREYPRISPFPRVEANQSTVKFSAEVLTLGDREIHDHGFIWGTWEDLDNSRASKLSLGSRLVKGVFEANIEYDLEKGGDYSMRAYLKSGDYAVYSDIVTFESTVDGMAPEFIDFYPKYGTWDDTIHIKGKNLTFDPEKIAVTIGSSPTRHLSVTDSSATLIILPEGYMDIAAVKLTLNGKTLIHSEPFIFSEPVLHDFFPKTGTFGDTITISGENIHMKREYSKIFFNGILVPTVEVSSTKLKAIIPDNLDKSELRLKVNITGKEISPPGTFKINRPTITKISPAVISSYEPGAISITGQNFNNFSAKNLVYIQGQVAPVVDATSDILTFLLPRQFVPDIDVSVYDTLTVKVKVLDQYSLNEVEVVIDYASRWTRKRDFPGPPRISGSSFSIDGRGYVAFGTEYYAQENPHNDLWEYDPKVDRWTEKAELPSDGRSHVVSFVLNAKAYFISGTTGNGYDASTLLQEVWEYDPQMNTWTRRQDFPGGKRFGAFGFTAGDRGYLGGGAGESGQYLDFWEYDPAEDSWMKKTGLSAEFHQEDIFGITLNGAGYALLGYCGSPCNKRFFWKYDALNDLWAEVASMPGPFRENTGFELNGRGYMGTGVFSSWTGTRSFYEYDPNSDSWSDMIFKGGERRAASSFSVGDKGFILLGKSDCHCANLMDVWEFDPTKP